MSNNTDLLRGRLARRLLQRFTGKAQVNTQPAMPDQSGYRGTAWLTGRPRRR